VKDQWGDFALLEEFSSSTASIEAGRARDTYGIQDGYGCESADGPSACTQALLDTKFETWVRLPRERWPQQWASTFRDPVVPLRLALHGHPDAGGYWEKHCERHELSVGFTQVPDWQSVMWHPELKLLLVVYVDDFKLAGPTKSLPQDWSLLKQGLIIDDPRPVDKYLGCNHILHTIAAPSPFNVHTMQAEGGTSKDATSAKTNSSSRKTIKMMQYDQSSFLKTCVEKYLELSGKQITSLRKVTTPFIDEHSAQAIDEDNHEISPGVLAPIASRVLMKILYAARVGRYDLLRPLCSLATKVTKWSVTCDRMLHRLVSYINSSLDVASFGWIGDPWNELKLVLYSDADWAGDRSNFKSTSGCLLALEGPRSFYPISCFSKKQTATSHSLPLKQKLLQPMTHFAKPVCQHSNFGNYCLTKQITIFA